MDDNLSYAVLQTIAYSDVFEYPLKASEIHRFLTGMTASFEEVLEALVAGKAWIRAGDYFTLPGRTGIIPVRVQREIDSRRLMPWALNYGRVLGALPFVRMVALTGSLAVLNSSKEADFDYLLIAARGRVWTARACALLLNRFVQWFGHTICPNLIISENALAWPRHDLYSARELCQMIPITGLDVYGRLLAANTWARRFLPNALLKTNSWRSDGPRERASALQRLVELPLRGKPGDRFEQWEMQRKVARFSKQTGFSEETVFNADVCQGNFDHHRKRTEEMLENRLSALGKEEGSQL